MSVKGKRAVKSVQTAGAAGCKSLETEREHNSVEGLKEAH